MPGKLNTDSCKIKKGHHETHLHLKGDYPLIFTLT